jgi:hypothetical protein
MPVERRLISRSQLCELLGVDPALFIDVEREPAKREDQRKGEKHVLGWVIVTEEEPMTQTRGTNPPLYGGGKKKPGGKKPKC